MRLLFESVVGSRLQRLDSPESDTDTAGVFIADLESLYSPFKPLPESNGQNEDTRWELQHFLRLATRGNWSAIEALYSDMPIHRSALGKALYWTRELVLDGEQLVRSAYRMTDSWSNRIATVEKTRTLVHRLRVLFQAIHFADTGEIKLDCSDWHILEELKFRPTDSLIDVAQHVAQTNQSELLDIVLNETHPKMKPEVDYLTDFCRVAYGVNK